MGGSNIMAYALPVIETRNETDAFRKQIFCQNRGVQQGNVQFKFYVDRYTKAVSYGSYCGNVNWTWFGIIFYNIREVCFPKSKWTWYSITKNCGHVNHGILLQAGKVREKDFIPFSDWW